jgi:sugar phosphate isomerase/epimerase
LISIKEYKFNIPMTNISRRKFLGTTTSAAAATALSSSFGQVIAESKPVFTKNDNFRLLILATNWGFNGTTDEFCAAAKKEGYDGIEIWWNGDNEAEEKKLFDALKKHDLQVGFLLGGWQTDPKEHLATFKKSIDTATAAGHQRPLYINCHSGRDFFSYDDNKPFIDYTNKIIKDTGVPVYHETHRGRMLFAAHITRQFLEKNPALRLTFDVSHWCNVHESLLADQPETIGLALQRTDHIHARIGHGEGPQVNDPRAPEWDAAVKQHLAWWDKIVEYKKQKGERLTILTEFGPPDYLPTLPYTRQPVADQWAINVYMMNLLRKRYS